MKNLINKLIKPFNSLEKDKKVAIALNMGLLKDLRYNEPKGEPKASEERVNETIEDTEIYSRAKELILNAQRKQVGYGLDKYPEPLNADTWSTIETIDHIIDESIDKLHYLVMLRVKLEQDADMKDKETEEEDNGAIADAIIKMRTHLFDGTTDRTLEEGAKIAEGWKHSMVYSGPECNLTSVNLANEIKIDSEGRVRGFHNHLINEDVDTTVHVHSTFTDDNKSHEQLHAEWEEYSNNGKPSFTSMIKPEPKIDIQSWAATTSAITNDIKVNYILDGEEKTKKVTIDREMLHNISVNENGYCGEDLDAIRYAIENAIRNDMF